MPSFVLLLAAAGFCVSLYAYIVELKLQKDATYKPACDLSDRVSCSKVMRSPYANLLMVSNALVGMGYYALLVALILIGAPHGALLFLAFAACIVSLELARILYTKIKSFCLVCTSIYVINFAMLAALLYKS